MKTIGETQHKLATWAESDPNRRFDRLLRLIANREWLAEAARIVLASSGARTPGIDGIDKQRLQVRQEQHLDDLRKSLLDESYRPQPVKRIYIPKTNGRLRPLGIPTLTDRIVQRAMLMAMEPIWESDFHRLSYGFRPERSAHHAVRTVKIQLQDGADTTRGRWIIEGDLASYFDTVHHRLLIRCVRRRVQEGRFVDLLWRFLKAGHIDRDLFTASSEGVPQGGVLSPLLSNCAASIRVRLRIAAYSDVPGRDRLPHLFCSWLGLRRRPGAEMAGVSERPASSAGSRYIIES
ncbi:reverse transcriptase domain-containing protein [Bradyrhizobium sp. CCBAU 45389]|uniref:reverse transcriptase domain-containing protein n=1 Tax=Bradyrhizobium sp. CCBAU 45389 TaxID=858429 RepID=UPI003FA46E7D